MEVMPCPTCDKRDFFSIYYRKYFCRIQRVNLQGCDGNRLPPVTSFLTPRTPSRHAVGSPPDSSPGPFLSPTYPCSDRAAQLMTRVYGRSRLSRSRLWAGRPGVA